MMMKLTTFRSTTFRSTLGLAIALSGVFSFAPGAIAQAAMAQAAPPGQKEAAFSLAEVPQDSLLNAEIVLESPRLSLGEFLKAVEAQTKVKLIVPASLATRALTLRLNRMKVREVMGSLGQIDGLEWQKAPNATAYSAVDAATPNERELLRLGDVTEFQERLWAAREAAGQNPKAVMRGVALDEEKLKTGVALSSLPPLDSGSSAKQQTAKCGRRLSIGAAARGLVPIEAGCGARHHGTAARGKPCAARSTFRFS